MIQLLRHCGYDDIKIGPAAGPFYAWVRALCGVRINPVVFAWFYDRHSQTPTNLYDSTE